MRDRLEKEAFFMGMFIGVFIGFAVVAFLLMKLAPAFKGTKL